MQSKIEDGRRHRVQILAAELPREHRQRLLRIARSHAASYADAEEAVSEALAAFLAKFDRLRAPPLAWVTITLKRASWAKRKHKREPLDRRAGQEAAPGFTEPGFSIADILAETPRVEETIERAEYVHEAREGLGARLDRGWLQLP